MLLSILCLYEHVFSRCDTDCSQAGMQWEMILNIIAIIDSMHGVESFNILCIVVGDLWKEAMQWQIAAVYRTQLSSRFHFCIQNFLQTKDKEAADISRKILWEILGPGIDHADESRVLKTDSEASNFTRLVCWTLLNRSHMKCAWKCIFQNKFPMTRKHKARTATFLKPCYRDSSDITVTFIPFSFSKFATLQPKRVKIFCFN